MNILTATIITETEMQTLVTQGAYHTYVSYIGGQGDVGIAEPRNGRGGPRYWFDNMQRLWFPIVEVPTVVDRVREQAFAYVTPTLWEYVPPVAQPPASSPYVYDDTITRAIQIRAAPDDAGGLEDATAIELALEHLGPEAPAWEFQDTERLNYNTLIVHFTHI